MFYIQKYSKLPVFIEIAEKRIKATEEGFETSRHKFIKNNSFHNFVKFRSKPLFVSFLILIFTSYSMIKLNIDTNSWVKHNGIITLIICMFYVALFIKYLKNLYQNKKSKIIEFAMFTGVIYITLSAIFKFDIYYLFIAGEFMKNNLSQLALYNYFYIFIFNSTFYFLVQIFDEDFKKMKRKNLNYYNSGNLLLIKED